MMTSFIADLSVAKEVSDINIAAGTALPRWSTMFKVTVLTFMVVLFILTLVLADGYYNVEKRLSRGQADRSRIIAEIDQMAASNQRIAAQLGVPSTGGSIYSQDDPNSVYGQPGGTVGKQP